MDKNAKILVAGVSGMVGSAIVRKLKSMAYTNIVGTYFTRHPSIDTILIRDREHEEVAPFKLQKVDLTNQAAVDNCFDVVKPEYVILAAARVGGIHANSCFPAQFIHDNLAIQTHVIHAAHRTGARRLLFLGSSCIYPVKAPQPLKEEYLLTGELEPTNEPYAVAKIAGIKMCEAYNRQYGTRFMAVMPTNLYGPNDNFNQNSSHVLPALIRKFHDAKLSSKSIVSIWGSGSPRREFLHVDDMAEACLFVMNLDDKLADKVFFQYPRPCYVNVGMGGDCTIGQLAELVRDIVGYKGEIGFDSSKPDGTPQKLLDVSRLNRLGWKALIRLKVGIMQTYRWYLDQRR